MAQRQVTAELKRQFWPVLIEDGFTATGRKAHRTVGQITAVVVVQGLSARLQRSLGVPPGSFISTVGIDVVSAQGPSPYPPVASERVPDIAEIRIQLQLARNSRPSVIQNDVWAVGVDFNPAEAVADVLASFREHAVPFLETWSDLATVYEILRTEPGWEIPPREFGEPRLDLPGSGDSPTRYQHLAAVARHLNLIDNEREHLEALVESRGSTPDDRARLSFLTSSNKTIGEPS